MGGGEELVSKKNYSALQFGLNIRGASSPCPSPGSPTDYVVHGFHLNSETKPQETVCDTFPVQYMCYPYFPTEDFFLL